MEKGLPIFNGSIGTEMNEIASFSDIIATQIHRYSGRAQYRLDFLEVARPLCIDAHQQTVVAPAHTTWEPY